MTSYRTIDNPQGYSTPIPTKTMFEYSKGTNITWNIPQYKTPRQYLDPILQMKQREWEKQKKGQKDKRHQTKKGFYMDYHIKISKAIPGANAHNSQEPWSFKKQQSISKHRHVDPKLKKRSYIQEIELEQQKRKKPGIGTYSLQKSQKQKDAAIAQLKKKKISIGEKKFYHEDNDYVSGGIPGAGNYNPHNQVRKIRQNKTVYKDWVKKHSEQKNKQFKRHSVLPAPGTYSPMNSTFTTFDILQKQGQKKRKSNFFGNDSRFQYTREDKKKIKQKRPDPSSYNTLYEWRSKSKSPKHRPLNETITSGFKTLSVYH